VQSGLKALLQNIDYSFCIVASYGGRENMPFDGYI